MAKLINGNGNPAIYAWEDADLIASLAGNVTCIANVGNKYAATEEDANTIGLADGVIITKEGRRIQLDAGNVDLFAIPTGSSGVTNYYIIGYKLVQQADSSQVAETFVQKMDSSSATIAEGTLRGGDNEVYVSVYRVTQVGFTINSVDGLLPELLDNSAINEDINQIKNNLSSASIVHLASSNRTGSGEDFNIDVTDYDGFIATLSHGAANFASTFIAKAQMTAFSVSHLDPLGKYSGVEYNADVLFDIDVTYLAKITTTSNSLLCSVYGVKFTR